MNIKQLMIMKSSDRVILKNGSFYAFYASLWSQLCENL